MTPTYITVRQLVERGAIPAGRSLIPNSYISELWPAVLPLPGVLMFPYLSFFISKRMSRKELVRELELLFSGEFNDPLLGGALDFMTDDETQYRDREVTIAKLLRANGYSYPTNILDMLNLYKELGILLSYDERGKTAVDMIVQPFPRLRERFLCLNSNMLSNEWDRNE